MATTNIWTGEKIRLRAVEPSDWEHHVTFNEDTETARRTYYIPFPQSREGVKQWAQEQSIAQNQSENYRFQIETLDGVYVGTINTHSSNLQAGTFGYGLAIMQEHRRKGYASEAIYLVIRYMFMERRFQKCTVAVYGFNPESMSLHERLGFVKEGQLRRMIYTDGQYFDMLYYGMSIEEFQAYFKNMS